MARVMAAFLVVGMMGAAARGNLVINPTYDSSVTGMANFAAVKSAFETAAGAFETAYTDNITVNITVAAGSDPVDVGSNQPKWSVAFTYAQMAGFLAADATSGADASAVAHLAAVDPTAGGIFYMTRAQSKALGQLPGNSVVSDGTFTFSTAFSYTFDPQQRSVAGKVDFIGLAEHEISEILGRTAGVNGINLGPGRTYLLYDLFRYSGAGQESVAVGDTGVYFSIDGGATSLKNFNGPGGGDVSDWASGGPIDTYNAVETIGAEEDLSGADVTAVDVMGYNLAPEPGTAGMVGVGIAVLLRRRRGRRG